MKIVHHPPEGTEYAIALVLVTGALIWYTADKTAKNNEEIRRVREDIAILASKVNTQNEDADE